MLTGIMPRRIAAALTAALVGMLLATFAGATHAATISSLSTVESVHSTATTLVSRSAHVELPEVQQPAPAHLDLTSTAAMTYAFEPTPQVAERAVKMLVRSGHAVSHRTSRGPPAL